MTLSSKARVDASQVPIPDATCNVEKMLSSNIISMTDIEGLLKSLYVTKATGLEQISKVILQKAGEVIVSSLIRLFNLSLSSGIYLDSWKQAIHKKNSNMAVDYYRPVSLVTCIGKLFEKADFKNVFHF